MGLLDSVGKLINDGMYLVFRILFGGLFALHGAQKLGFLGGETATGLMFVVGVGELLVGLGVFFGVLTRLAAVGGVIIMVGALMMAHLPKGLMPLGNGEAAWLYLVAFLYIFAIGGGKLSLEKLLFKKELL